LALLSSPLSLLNFLPKQDGKKINHKKGSPISQFYSSLSHVVCGCVGVCVKYWYYYKDSNLWLNLTQNGLLVHFCKGATESCIFSSDATEA
jgi:hypothetical protein